jgi:uncharacterized protein
MVNPPPPLAAEIDAVRDAYAALNRNDVAGFVAIFDPQIERIEPADLPHDGTYRGLPAVTEHVAAARATWAEGGCYPERFMVVGDRVIAFVHVRVRLKTEAEWRDGRIVDVFTFRHGKAIQFRTFFDERQGLEWAGVKPAKCRPA